MNELETLRNKIDEIDEKMVELFIKRMMIVKEVAVFKKNNQLNVVDTKREKEIISKHLNDNKVKELNSYVESFIQNNIFLSRIFQKELSK